MSILEGIGMYPRESRGQVRLQVSLGWSRELSPSTMHGGLGGCGVRIPVLVQYVSCQVEGVAARGKMGVAAAAKEGLLPRATAHVLRRRRERFR